MQPSFYLDVVNILLQKRLLSLESRILVLCGGPRDRDVLSSWGFRNVVISNLDTRMTGERASDAGLLADVSAEYAPYEWSQQDAESLSYPDQSFDTCIVHEGLHHCRSPHRALLEMYRVARTSVLLFEPLDSFATRIGVRLGVGQEYECAAVYANGCESGGLRNGWLPNYVFRWTRREIEQTLRSADPTGRQRFDYYFQMVLPTWQLSARRGWLWRLASKAIAPVASLIGTLAPTQVNNFAAFVRKPVCPGDLHPWLAADALGKIALDRNWLARRFR